MRKYLVRDIMTTTPVTIQESESAKKCADVMTSKGVGSLLVKKKDAFMGIVTEQDLVIKVVSSGVDSSKILVKDIMTPFKELISIESARSVYSAMALMNNNDIRRVPVVDEGVLKGLVTMKDIFGIEPDLLENMFEYLPEEYKEL